MPKAKIRDCPSGVQRVSLADVPFHERRYCTYEGFCPEQGIVRSKDRQKTYLVCTSKGRCSQKTTTPLRVEPPYPCLAQPIARYKTRA